MKAMKNLRSDNILVTLNLTYVFNIVLYCAADATVLLLSGSLLR
jgi:hypothetical protein